MKDTKLFFVSLTKCSEIILSYYYALLHFSRCETSPRTTTRACANVWPRCHPIQYPGYPSNFTAICPVAIFVSPLANTSYYHKQNMQLIFLCRRILMHANVKFLFSLMIRHWSLVYCERIFWSKIAWNSCWTIIHQ